MKQAEGRAGNLGVSPRQCEHQGRLVGTGRERMRWDARDSAVTGGGAAQGPFPVAGQHVLIVLPLLLLLRR